MILIGAEMTLSKITSTSTHSGGFTLLEVLVAVVVLSIGLLGIAQLNLHAMKLQEDSVLRARASTLAVDMADRMRANLAEVITNPSTSTYNNPAQLESGEPNCLGEDANGVANDSQCSNAAMALHDFYEWNSKIAGRAATNWHDTYPVGLPSGVGVVCIDSTPDDGTPVAPACDNSIASADTPVFAIKLWWVERKDDLTANRRFVMSFTP